MQGLNARLGKPVYSEIACFLDSPSIEREFFVKRGNTKVWNSGEVEGSKSLALE